MACGRVRLDRRIISSAPSFSSGSRPSAPPIRKAVSPPSCIQCSRRCASCCVVRSLPRSSRAMLRLQPAMAGAMRAFSAAVSCSRVLLPLGSGLISMTESGSSRGMRLMYSLHPLATQSGILWPTAAISSFMPLRCSRRRHPLQPSCGCVPSGGQTTAPQGCSGCERPAA